MSIQKRKQTQLTIAMIAILVGGLFMFLSCNNDAKKNQGKAGKATLTGMKDSALPEPPPPPPAPVPPGDGNSPDTNGVYKFAQQMPHFPGGTAALMKYLIQNTKYPEEAKENKVHGTVLVRFVVNENGSISDIKVVSKKHGNGLEEEAIRVVKSMPDWIPGTQDGKPVKVQSSLPIRFMPPR